MPKTSKAAPDAPAKRAKYGRPTLYDKRYVKQAYQLALLGLTNEELAAVFGVAESTWKVWLRAHPELLATVREGRTIADGQVAAKLFERALGYSHPETVITSYEGVITKTRVTKHYAPDTQAGSLWLRNRQPARWRAQPDPLDGTDAPQPVQITVRVEDGRRPADA